MTRISARRLLAGGALVLVAPLFTVVLLLAALRIDHTFPTTLPTPTGSFPVGRAIYDWADGAPDSLAPVPGATRELLVWIWYPAAPAPSNAAADDYLPLPMRTAAERARGAQGLPALLMDKFLTRDLSKVHAHSMRNAQVATQQRSYPVVVMRGGASAGVTNYSTLAEDLASHGYVVVGFDAPYRTNFVAFPSGRTAARTDDNNPERMVGAPDSARRMTRLMAAWTGDIAFVLDLLQRINNSAADTANGAGRFAGRLDLSRVGVFGHSLGGAAAAQFCHDDSRCAAGIDVDGAPLGSVIRDGIPRPFMFLMSDHGGSSDPGSREILANIQSIYDRLPPHGRMRIAIRGANHFLFSDDGALLKSQIVLRLLRLFGVIGIEGRRQLAVTTYCVHTFFDSYLTAAGAKPFSISSPLYPEIQVLE